MGVKRYGLCQRCYMKRHSARLPDACPCRWSDKLVVREWADIMTSILNEDEEWMTNFFEMLGLFSD